MTRTSEYGSPFRNKDSGVDESKDKVNIQRLNTGFKNFVAQNKGIASSPLPLLFSPWPLFFYSFKKISCPIQFDQKFLSPEKISLRTGLERVSLRLKARKRE